MFGMLETEQLLRQLTWTSINACNRKDMKNECQEERHNDGLNDGVKRLVKVSIWAEAKVKKALRRGLKFILQDLWTQAK